MRAIYRWLIREHGLKPNDIDEMSLAQVGLYFDDDGSATPEQEITLEEAKARDRQIYIRGLTERLERSGTVAPANLADLPKEELDRLWFSIRG